MRLRRSRSAILIKLVIEYSTIMPEFQYARHDKFIELGMSLHTPQSLRHIQTLDRAPGAVAEIDTACGQLMHHITVHLLEMLDHVRQISILCVGYVRAYQLVFAEYLFANICQSNLFNGDLPSIIATTNARAEGTSNNLMAKTDPNNGLLVLLNHAPDVIGETHDPSIICE